MIEKIHDYIDKNIDKEIFASLHIDRDEDPRGKIVLSFTEEITDEMKGELNALTDGTVELIFRLVPLREEQLVEKQREVDELVFREKVFANKGIDVNHTSVDIIDSKVEIGIFPFTEETKKVVEDYFDDEMIEVVEGAASYLLMSYDQNNDENGENNLEVEKTSFFQKVLDWFRSLFSKING